MQRQDSSQATSTLGNTPNLHMGSHTKGTDRDKVRHCAVPDNLRSEILFSRTFNIPNFEVKNHEHFLGRNRTLLSISHSPFFESI